MAIELGTLGIWIHWGAMTPERARELEDLGYGTVWLGGSPPGDLSVVDDLLAATDHLTIATGIVNVWTADAHAVAASHHRITAAHPDRFLLGVGVGHPEATSDYRRPYATLVEYLDVLDEEGVPVEQRVLAALGPKVLELSKDRSLGAHPYLTTAEHTGHAREQLGPDVLIAPEQKIVIDPDPVAARTIGRPAVAKPYLGLTNYVSNLKRLGWTDADVADGGSDALIDALVGHGAAPDAVRPVREHFAAGADHVAIQLITPRGVDPLAGYAALAAELIG